MKIDYVKRKTKLFIVSSFHLNCEQMFGKHSKTDFDLDARVHCYMKYDNDHR